MNSIPLRSKQAITDLIDLTGAYTGSLESAGLASLPQSVQMLADVVFDVRGVVRGAAEGIQVSFQGPLLHFLQAALGSADLDAEIAEYVLRYADGQTVTLPLVYGRNISDIRPGGMAPTDAAIAWEDDAAQVFRYTAHNPLPTVDIESISIVPAGDGPTPLLIALTIDRNDPTYEAWTAARIDDFCPIAPRAAGTSPDLVDLSEHYTSSLDDDWFNHAGHDLCDVPRGVQTLGGVPFDIRGLVQTAACKTLEITGVVFPETVNGIAVGRKGKRLCFLQACFWNTEPGSKLGEYVIHYADGETASAPIIYGENVMDWWVRPDGVHLSDAETVWQGSNPATASMGLTTHLIKYTWVNPRPEVEISAIDIVSALIEASPFVVAITVDNS